MAERLWTKEQRDCIETRGGTVLVSAAAGSGKTSVLVQRVIGLVTGKHPVDIDRLLVVTFTKAAAAEMRMRLSDALSALVGENPGDMWLQRQQMLLAGASICTVDSFCAELLRANFHRIGLPPDFRVAEPADASGLEEDALSETVEALYREEDPDFMLLADYLGDKRSDDGLFSAIKNTAGFIGSHARPMEWLSEKAGLFQRSDDISKSLWGRVILRDITRSLESCAAMMSRAEEIAGGDPVMAEKYCSCFASEGDSIRAAAHSLQNSSWDGAAAILDAVTFDRLPALRNYDDEQRKESVRKIRDGVKKTVAGLHARLCGSEAECKEDLSALHGMVEALFGAVRLFIGKFKEKKSARGMVDFTDLEHYTLGLLVDENSRRTPLAEELAGGFAEVLVDEYQDTNEVQDTIFRALSRDENNLFMVGDVKQSIYGFRQAMPEIFIRRRDAYVPYDGENYPAAITLGDNFRSRVQVTDAVNFVFRRIMTKAIGGVDYDDRERLIPSADYPEERGRETELIVIDGSTRGPLDTKDAAEARVIAKKISGMMESFRVFEKGAPRAARYGDFCILLRSGAAHARGYADELKRCGIPVWTSSPGGFFRASEIGWALAYLRIIDNPAQDIPLLAAMMSPVGGFSPDDLALIRVSDRKAPLFTVLTRYARSGEDAGLRSRAAAFLSRIDALRILAVTLPADRLIHRLYEETGMTSAAMAMKRGGQRVANLRMLHSRAASFEQKGFRGLSAFVRMLNRAQERGEDFAAAAADSGDAVRIMTIHGSKGLEFPVVFLAGLGGRFNNEAATKRILFHTETGVGLKRYDSERLVQWSTVPFEAAKLAIRDTALAEEIRVLYVAMTRAKEKLVMVMTDKSPETTLPRLAALSETDGKLPPYAILAARGLGDWILTAALHHPSGTVLREVVDTEQSWNPPEGNENVQPWEISVIISPAPFTAESEHRETLRADPELTKTLSARMSWVYPHAAASAVPAKLAASSLSHGMGRISRENAAKSRPAFLGESGLTPAERGTALHMFMQFCSYPAAAADIGEEIRRLAEKGFLTKQQAAVIDRLHVNRFFSGALYARIRAADRIWRELDFTVDIPASRLSADPLSDDEIVIIQGIADCVIEEKGALVVIDYKTDRIKTLRELAERYRVQMDTYAYALARVLGMPVRECILYSFYLDAEVVL